MIITLVACLTLAAQDDLTVLSADDNPKQMLYSTLMKEAGARFEERRAAVEALKTPEEFRSRQKMLRAKFVEAIGGYPERTPLNGKTVAREEAEDYVIEKVIYESRPNHHVSATLYLPKGKGPFPGVLMPMGHWGEGKAAGPAQRGCILLATNGIAALCYDPIGQGERYQILDGQGKPVMRSTSEHTQVGIGALLVGQSTAGYRIWDGIRSFDYLASRPEVDGKKMGCTGCSGGGTMTSYLMALDSRVVAAAPSCYITTLEKLFETRGPQDAEQNITGQVAFGMNHADYVTIRAPQPTLLLTATRDFFDIDGSWDSFREAKRLYGLIGFGERVDMAEYDTKHGYPREQRQSMVRWMSRWLAGKDRAIVEPDFPIRKKEELLCTSSGQVLHSLKGVSAFQLNAEYDRKLAAARPKRTPEELRKVVAQRIRHQAPPKVKAANPGKATWMGHEIQKARFETEPGIVVPVLIATPKKASEKPAIVYVNGEGMKKGFAAGGPIGKWLAEGRFVIAMDLRGMGETQGSDFKNAFMSFHLDRPLLGQRVDDLLSVVKGLGLGKHELVGVGSAGPVVLHAAFLGSGADRVTLDTSVVSWSSVVQIPLSKNQLAGVVPGVLKDYDLPDVVAALSLPVVIRNGVDAAGKPLPVSALRKAYPGTHVTIQGGK